MTWVIVLLAAGTMLLLAIVMSYVLGWASRAFHVEVNPLVDQALAILPGANCGGCGYVGCSDYAEAVAEGKAPANLCPVGGDAVAQALAKLLGLELEDSHPIRAMVHCGATTETRLKQREYRGERTCSAANLVAGLQGCAYGCLGMGDCDRACNYDAIHVVDGLATVDYDKCVGCGACERACPRRIISMVPFKFDRMIAVTCSNLDKGKDVKSVCPVGCIACGLCAKVSDIFTVEGNLSRMNYEAYDASKVEDMEKAVEKCPPKCIQYRGDETKHQRVYVEKQAVPDALEPQSTVDGTQWQG